MSFNEEEYKRKHKRKLNTLKELGKKVYENKNNTFEDTDIVFYYNIFDEKIYSDKYSFVKIFSDTPFKTIDDAKLYKKFFKKFSQTINEAMMENFNDNISKFVDFKDVATGGYTYILQNTEKK
jgi:hypothetical protein